jgi:rRNA maturation endonuclease Nob1
MIVIVPSATITLPILIIWVSEMQKRCIGCNVVIGHKKHYCFRCLTELTEKAGENNE